MYSVATYRHVLDKSARWSLAVCLCGYMCLCGSVYMYVCVQQLHTDVLTVNLFSCDGEPIAVTNLTSDHVELSIPHTVQPVSLSVCLVLSGSSIKVEIFLKQLVKPCFHYPS